MMIAIDGSHPRKGPENDRLRSDAGSREKHLDDDPAPAEWGEWPTPRADAGDGDSAAKELVEEEFQTRIEQHRWWVIDRASCDFYGDLACYNDPLPPSSIRMAESVKGPDGGVDLAGNDWHELLVDDIDYAAGVFRCRGQGFLDYVEHALFRPGWKRANDRRQQPWVWPDLAEDGGLFGSPRLDAVNVWVVRHQPGNDPTYYMSMRQLGPSSSCKHGEPLSRYFGSLGPRTAKPSQVNPLWMNWWDGLDDADLDVVGQALRDEGQALIDYADNGLRAAGCANPGDPNPGDLNPGGHDARGHDQGEW